MLPERDGGEEMEMGVGTAGWLEEDEEAEAVKAGATGATYSALT
jgi:hypothetical protein